MTLAFLRARVSRPIITAAVVGTMIGALVGVSYKGSSPGGLSADLGTCHVGPAAGTYSCTVIVDPTPSPSPSAAPSPSVSPPLPSATPAPTPTPTVAPTPSPANLVPVDSTGATDVTAALNAYIATVPNGSTINFKSGGTYKISSSIDLRGRSDLVFEGNGATLNNVANANSGSSEPDSFFYTQAPGHSGAVSTNITIRDFTAKGANPTPGKLPAGEFAAFLTAYGGSGYTVTNVTASGLFGDFVTFNGAATGAEISGNHITDCGRNSISVVWGSNITDENNTIGTCGWSIFDVEPEAASAGSTISGLVFRNNSAVAWSSATGFFFAADGNASTHINGVTVTGNTISQSSIQTIVNVSRRQNITFTNNTGLAAQPVKQGEPGMLTFAHIDGLTVTGNVQPLSSGTLLSITDCTSVVHQ